MLQRSGQALSFGNANMGGSEAMSQEWRIASIMKLC